MRVALVALVVAAGACTREPQLGNHAPYEIVCDSADTDETSTMFCVRIDTRTGDLRRVALDKIPRLEGAAAAQPDKGAGAFQLACDSTNTATKADFRCVRLDRNTGDVVLVNLPSIPTMP
jgi:hypothetical protein